MVTKRQLQFGGEDSSESLNKRRNLSSSLLKEVNDGRAMQEIVPFLEPIIRKWVQEAVESSLERILRHSHNQSECECSGARTLQLQFHHNLPHTLFTGHRVVSEDRSPVKVVLRDSKSRKVITSGPLSSTKVSIVVLDADFGTDRDDWTKKEFNRSVVQSREGKRPLVTGELTVTLQDGIGHVGDLSFTDNSSWLRGGKFCLAAKAITSCDEIREGVSNSFRVKDQRGEPYMKHYPPSMNDEVWRLEKIAKGGPYHEKLSQNGILSVGDFLRFHAMDQSLLQAMLPKISNRTWSTIVEHATTCPVDDGIYLYETGTGIGLYFNSIYKVVGCTDGQTYQSVDNFNSYAMRMVEGWKQHAYKNRKAWVLIGDSSNVGYASILGNPAAQILHNPDLGVPNNYFQDQDQLEAQLNAHPSISSLYNSELDQDTSSFELGESSNPMQGFIPSFGNSFEVGVSSGGFYIGGNHGSQLSVNNIPVEDSFQVNPSALWKENTFFVDSTNHETGITASDSGILISRNGNPKAKWRKLLAVVKWRILVKRSVATRKLQHYYSNYVLLV